MRAAPTNLPRQLDLVAGSWVSPALDGPLLAHPDTGESLGPAATSPSENIDRALAAATSVHRAGEWAGMPWEERVGALRELAKRLSALDEEIAVADAIDSGVPIRVTRMVATSLPSIVEDVATIAASFNFDRVLSTASGDAHLLRSAWGPAVVIAPYNAPAFTIVKKCTYALAAGCPVIVKPSPQAPHAAAFIASAAQNWASELGLPPGLFQLVHGGAECGTRLAADPRIGCLSFTGGRTAARAVAVAAAANLTPTQIEGGSNNPAVVLPDADTLATASSLASGFTKLNGQWCERPGTAFAHADSCDSLVEAIGSTLETLVSGACLDERTEFGPQGNEPQLRRVEESLVRLAKNGAKVRRFAPPRNPEGFYAAPALVTGAVPADTTAEIFGPVLVVHCVGDVPEAMDLASRVEGGLAGYIFGQNVNAAIQLGCTLEAGEVKVNGTSLVDLHPDSAQSFWGGSGLGGHGNADLLRFFCGTRIIGTDLMAAPI